MDLPPLANFFAAFEPDGDRRAALLVRMRTWGDFSVVREGPGAWVSGWVPLPGRPVPDAAFDNGFLFAEGVEQVVPPSAPDADDRCQTLATLVAERPTDLDTVPGDVTFAHLRADGSATAVRSCAGLAPIFHATRRGRVAIGTRIRYFARYAGSTDPDWMVLALWMAPWPAFPGGRTFLEGCVATEPGSAVTLSAGTASIATSYWDPWPVHRTRAPGQATQEDRARELGHVILEDLAENLPTDEPSLLALSGGADSSTLGALAAGHLDRPVATVTMSMEQADVRAEILSYIGPLSEMLPFGSMSLLVSPDRDPNPFRHQSARIITPVVSPILCVLPRLVAETNTRVLFGGQFADDVVGGHVTYPDWARATPLSRLLALRRNPEGLRDLARAPLWRWRQFTDANVGPSTLPTMFHQDIQAEWRQTREAEVERFVDDLHQRRALQLAHHHAGWTTQLWEACSESGIRPYLPFLTRAVIEWSAHAHPRELIGPGLKRPLVRAFRGMVPERNLVRGKGGRRWDRTTWNEPVAVDWQDDAGLLREVLSPATLDSTMLPGHEASRLAYLQLALEGIERAIHPDRLSFEDLARTLHAHEDF